MKYGTDEGYLLSTLQQLIETPSPVGYSLRLNPILSDLVRELDLTMTFDRRDCGYLTVEGEDNTKTVLLTAHADTLGMMVRSVNADGTLKIRVIGGLNLATMDGETVTVHTRDGKDYTGLVLCRSHSTHAFADACEMPRNEDNMMILLDERVESRADVEALGICRGDLVSVDPRFQVTERGFVKSRFIDDKGGIACCLTALKYLKDHGLKPKYRTLFQFPYSEEVGTGCSYIPEGVDEMIGVDIGLIGPDCDGSEYGVSICAKDASQVYDYALTGKLIRCAKEAGCRYAVDLFYRYGSDVGAARRAGHNVRGALFGMAVYGSHGMERTHVDGLNSTVNLMLAYLLNP